MAIRILIADDDSLITEGLKIILDMEDDFRVIDCVSNGKEAVYRSMQGGIDLALLDIRMPIMNGVDATKEIVENTNIKVLILTTFDEDDLIKEAMRNGAKGYLLKNNSPDKIKDAIRTIYNGNSVIQDEVLDKLINNLENKSDNSFSREDFTDREMDIIKAIAEGLSNKEISKRLFISEGTVKNYISSILNKTKLRHRTQIAISYLKGNI